MIRYKCCISDSKGKISYLYKNAINEQALIKEINDQSLYLVSFSEAEERTGRRYSKKIIIDFTETMALLLQSGLSIKDALKVSDGDLVNTIAESLKRGDSFSDAINDMSSDFPQIYRGMIRIGDQTGSMDDIFSKLSKYLIDEKLMREKIQSALIYPVLVLSVLFLGMIVLFIYFFPRIRESFVSETLDHLLLRFQIMIIAFSVFFLLLILAILFIAAGSKRSGKIREISETLKLKIPVTGSISSMRSTLNIMFSLEVLTSSGFPLDAAIEESAHAVSNSVIASSLMRIRKSIIGGEKLSLSFKREKIFPVRISQWIAIGEASGAVSKVFSQLRFYYQAELDRITSRIMLLVEPVLIVFVGIFLILFVLLIVLPVFSVFGAAI